MPTPLIVSDVAKTFTMHLRGGIRLPVFERLSFTLTAGKCAVLAGPSGTGKSTVMKMVYGNYGVDCGQIIVDHRGRLTDIASADPRAMLDIRRHTVGYVSQFLRVVPRVAALDVAAEPLVERGESQQAARALAGELFERLNLPKALWSLPPATFSGGEQQRVNIARGFITAHTVLLLDEPTASLDAANRQVVMELIGEKKRSGVALLGIFHDQDVRQAVADAVVDITEFSVSGVAA